MRHTYVNRYPGEHLVRSREVIEPVTLAGQTIPVGAQVIVPWVTQRDTRWWTDSLCFDPDRWLPPAVSRYISMPTSPEEPST